MPDPDTPITVPRGYVDRLRHGWMILLPLAAILSVVLILAPVLPGAAAIGAGLVGLGVVLGIGSIVMFR